MPPSSDIHVEDFYSGFIQACDHFRSAGERHGDQSLVRLADQLRANAEAMRATLLGLDDGPEGEA